MKKLTLIILFTLAAAYVAFGQDSLFIGTPQTDMLTGSLIDCYGYQFSPQASHTYIVASNYNGAIDIGGDGPAEVLIMTENYIHFDTCTILTPWAGMELRLLFEFPSGARIIINSHEGASVTVFSKTDSAVTRQLPAPIAFTDTLCTIPTSTANTTPTPRRLMEFDGHTWRQVNATRPNMLYKEF